MSQGAPCPTCGKRGRAIRDTPQWKQARDEALASRYTLLRGWVRAALAAHPTGQGVRVSALMDNVSRAHGASSVLAPRPVWVAMLRLDGWQPGVYREPGSTRAVWQWKKTTPPVDNSAQPV